MISAISLVLTYSSTVYSIGMNGYSQLGPGGNRNKFTIDLFSTSPTYLTSNYYNTFYIDEKGDMYGRGNHDTGLLIEHTSNQPDFIKINKFVDNKKIKQFHTTGDNMVILTEELEVYTGGRNTYGQLGRNTSTNDVYNYKKIDYEFGTIKKVGATNNLFTIIQSNTGLFGTIYNGSQIRNQTKWKQIPLPQGVEKIVDFQCLQKSFVIFDQDGQMWNMSNYNNNQFVKFEFPGSSDGDKVISWKDARQSLTFNTTAGCFFVMGLEFFSGVSVFRDSPYEIYLPTGLKGTDLLDFIVIESGIFLLNNDNIYAQGRSNGDALGLGSYNSINKNWGLLDKSMITSSWPNVFSEAVSYETYMCFIETTVTINIEVRTNTDKPTSQVNVKITNIKLNKILHNEKINSVLVLTYIIPIGDLSIGDDLKIEVTDDSGRYTNAESTINIFKVFTNEVLIVKEYTDAINIEFGENIDFSDSLIQIIVQKGKTVIYNGSLNDQNQVNIVRKQLSGVFIGDSVTIQIIDENGVYFDDSRSTVLVDAITNVTVTLEKAPQLISSLKIQYYDPDSITHKSFMAGSAILTIEGQNPINLGTNEQGWMKFDLSFLNLEFPQNAEIVFTSELPYIVKTQKLILSQRKTLMRVVHQCHGDNKKFSEEGVCQCVDTFIGFKGKCITYLEQNFELINGVCFCVDKHYGVDCDQICNQTNFVVLNDECVCSPGTFLKLGQCIDACTGDGYIIKGNTCVCDSEGNYVQNFQDCKCKDGFILGDNNKCVELNDNQDSENNLVLILGLVFGLLLLLLIILLAVFLSKKEIVELTFAKELATFPNKKVRFRRKRSYLKSRAKKEKH